MTAEIRELLELAAQAAEVSIHHQDEHGNIHTLEGDTWNPLESGDDLIDLIDKREIRVLQHECYVQVWSGRNIAFPSVTEDFSNHPTRKAALAMAVLRCAAEWMRRKG